MKRPELSFALTGAARFWVAVCCLVTVSSGLNGCRKDTSPTDVPLELRVGYIPIAECVELYVAQAEGFFQREGLDVELVSLPGGARILETLGQDVDVGFTNVVSLAINRSQGRSFFSIYGASYETPSHQNHALLMREAMWTGAPAASLRGARIALNTRYNIEELALLRYLESIGVGRDEVELQTVGFPEMLPLLVGGSFDAVSIVEPFITAGRQTEGIQYVANHYLATADRVLVATYVSSDAVEARKGEELRRFVRAMEAATRYIADGINEMRVRQIIGANTRIADSLLTRIGLPLFEPSVDSSAFQAIIDDMVRFGFFESAPPPPVSAMIRPRQPA